MAYQINLLKSVLKNTGTMREKVKAGFSDAGNALVVSEYHEPYDPGKLNALARSICQIDPESFPEVIVVATAVSARDKGVVAAHIASAIAHMPGQSVFLIDADLPFPSLHTQFGFADKPGLSEYLSRESTLSSLIQKTPVDRLQLLTAGHLKGSWQDLLSSEKMTRFIRELKTKCSGLVIMVNTDLTIFSEMAPSFIEHVDGLVLSIDESLLPPDLQKKVVSFPKRVKLLGSIRKQSPGIGDPNKALTVKQQTQHAKEVSTLKEKTVSRPLVALSKAESYEAAQFDKLTADMVQTDILKRHRVFMFTSPSSGDGKSYVSCNSAVSLARNTGKQVLIIDCDLRSPSIHLFFRIPNNIGLSDFLSRENAPLSDYIRKTNVDNLSILPAGPFAANALQLLSSEKMVKLIEGLKKRFSDMVIILDGAPPNLMAEGSVVSKYADSIILVVSHYRTNREEVKKLAAMFEKERIYGIIYNNYEGRRKTYNRYNKAA